MIAELQLSNTTGSIVHGVFLIGLVVIAVLIGRKWRGQYKGAIDLRVKMENEIKIKDEMILQLSTALAVQQKVDVRIGGTHGATLNGDSVESIADSSRGVGVGDAGAVLPGGSGRLLGVQEVEQLLRARQGLPPGAVPPAPLGGTPDALPVGER